MTMKKIFILLFAAVCLLCVPGCHHTINANPSMDLQGKKAPGVSNPAIELNLPTAVAASGPSTESGPAISTQNSNRFSYQIMSENKKLPDTSVLTGVVSEMTKNRLSFKTSEGRSILMDYTLPGNAALLVSSNEAVSLVKKESVHDASQNKYLLMKGTRGIIISSASQLSRTPVQLELNKGLVIRQGDYDGKKIISDTKYDTQFSAPASLLVNGTQVALNPGDPFSFSYNGAKYKLSLFQSRYIQPKKEFISVSEGQGYLLNYLLLLTE
jgi:hypothetical protein